jgi:hypothetical protein
VRAVYDIGPKESAVIPGTDRTRIFDGHTTTTVSEVKNVGYQAFTLQLRDILHYARLNDLQFDLYVRSGAKLSAPLKKALEDNKRFFQLRDIP